MFNKNCLRRFYQQLCFGTRHRLTYIVAMILLLLIVLFDHCRGGTILSSTDSLWNTRIHTLVDVGTFVTAIAVLLVETSRDWRNSLEKRLTVEFVFDNRLLMRCEKAYLTSESDIRQLAQQIGSQMVDPPQNLKFKVPYIKLASGEIIDFDDGKSCLHYSISFELTDLGNIDTLKNLGADEYILWSHPFDKREIKNM